MGQSQWDVPSPPKSDSSPSLLPAASAVDTRPLPEIPRTVSTVSADSMFHLSPAGKIFLDVCAGATCPLSTAMVQNSRMSLPIDKIIAEQHDILNDFHYERILRIASSGCAGYTAASPSCV